MYRRYRLLAGLATVALASCGVGIGFVGVGTAASPTPPATITARLITRQPGTAKLGTGVPLSGLGQRVFINKRVGFALGCVGLAQYPAKTTDGGAVWKTFGPALHVTAAQAPLAVTEIGVANAHTIYFYGSGQVVDTTGDGGKHWWRAYLPGIPVAIVYSRVTTPAELVALAEYGSSRFWVYVSSDGGHHWHYHNGWI